MFCVFSLLATERDELKGEGEIERHLPLIPKTDCPHYCSACGKLVYQSVARIGARLTEVTNALEESEFHPNLYLFLVQVVIHSILYMVLCEVRK